MAGMTGRTELITHMYHLNWALVVVEEQAFASLLNQGGEGGTSFRDGSAAVDESSNMAQAAGRLIPPEN